jgi:hypothetical protein
MKNGFLLVFGILAAVLAGCGKPQMMQAQPVCLEAISQDKLMQVVEKTDRKIRSGKRRHTNKASSRKAIF